MIKLEDFVAETLRQIIGGVKQAQAYAAQHGGQVVPWNAAFRTSEGTQIFDRGDGTPVQNVDFDVAVTSVEGSSTKGGIGVFVGPLGLGSQGQSNESSQHVSKIRFSVPIILPKQHQGGA